MEIAALSRQIRRAVRDGFYQAEFAKAVSAQKAELQTLARRLRDIAQSRFEAGDVAQLEVIQADLEAARADAELQLARQEEGVAMSRLNALLNEPAVARWDLVSALDALPALRPPRSWTNSQFSLIRSCNTRSKRRRSSRVVWACCGPKGSRI